MASSPKRKKPAQSPKSKAAETTSPARWMIVGVLIVVAIFGAYRVLSASNHGSAVATTSTQAVSSGQQSGARVTGPEVAASAQVAGGVQTIAIDVTTVYTPNVINLKAGVPAELTFKGGQGCTTVVHSDQLGFSEDLSTGPKTVKLKALQPGTYQFSCGMNMVFGKVVVE
jgi:plastocyanin